MESLAVAGDAGAAESGTDDILAGIQVQGKWHL